MNFRVIIPKLYGYMELVTQTNSMKLYPHLAILQPNYKVKVRILMRALFFCYILKKISFSWLTCIQLKEESILTSWTLTQM